jgi:hypothetical protein
MESLCIIFNSSFDGLGKRKRDQGFSDEVYEDPDDVYIINMPLTQRIKMIKALRQSPLNLRKKIKM